jgi:hypothetical protein
LDGWIGTHQDASSGGLSGDELAGPVFGVGDESAFELLLGLARRFGQVLLLEVTLAVLGRSVFTAADHGQAAPDEDDREAGQEGEDAGQEEAPPLAVLEAFLLLRREDVTFAVVRHLVVWVRVVKADEVVVIRLVVLILRELHFDKYHLTFSKFKLNKKKTKKKKIFFWKVKPKHKFFFDGIFSLQIKN